MSETSKAYNRGYWAGSKGYYPKGKPPVPPEQIISELITALGDLCNAVDVELATLGEDDEWQVTLGDPVEVGYAAIERYREWLRERD